MKKNIRRPLLLEQLEERIFLDANPLVPTDGGEDPTAIAVDVPVESAAEAVAPELEPEEQVTASNEGEDSTLEAASEEKEEAVDSTEPSEVEEETVDGDDGLDASGEDESLDEPLGEENDAEEDLEAEVISAGDADNDIDAVPEQESSLELTGDEENVVDEITAIDPMIGEDFTFSVGFDNTTGSDVFGPYIDLLLDGGEDGDDTGGSGDDGITFQEASYLGTNVESTVIDITSDGQVIIHPYATDADGNPLELTGINGQIFQAGDQFVSLLMPFGSFTPDQPEAVVEVTAHMGVNADVDVDLYVHTTTGAMFGHDALDNPTSDTPLRDITSSSTVYKPEVITYNKDIVVQDVGSDCQEQHDPAYDDTRELADDPSQIFEINHQEIPTGPNFPATYVATVDIADDQTVSGLSLTDHLPGDIVYSGNVVVEVGGVALASGEYSVSLTGSDLTIELNGDVTGSSANDDVVISYDFYVPDILDPGNGDDAHIINDGEVGYSWDSPDNAGESIIDGSIDPEVDADGHFSSNENVDDISHAQSIAIQKTHSIATDTGYSGYTPGDLIQFTLTFQISDYFSFGDIVIDDLLADGMNLVPVGSGSNVPTIQIYEGGSLLVDRNIAGAELLTGVNGEHDETLQFDVSQILRNDGNADGLLEGGYTHGNADGATYGVITYWAEIQQLFDSPVGGGENNVDQGDIMSGGVTINGNIYNADGTATGGSESDESCDSLSIVTGEVAKDIYAITHDGVTTYSPGNNPHLSPGDTVTYLLHYEMPLSSTESFQLTDYLPLPVFDVNDPDQDGSASGWTFDATLFDGSSAPASGFWGFTSSDTYHTLDVPDSVTAGAGNTLVFDYGEYHDAVDTDAVIDIVFTITISDEPFADGMFLTNQVRATEQGTLLTDHNTDAIIQIVLDEPELTINKDALPTSGIDAGDSVDFTVTVENTGHAAAFDTIIRDTLPDGFDPNAATFTVSLDGTFLTAGVDYVWAGGGLDGDFATTADNFFADPGADGVYGTADDGNLGGIELIDTGLGKFGAGETLIVGYTLIASDNIAPQQILENIATITNYAGAEGATDHTTQDISDNAVVEAADVVVDKVISDTSQDHTAGSNVTIGETVTYTVTIELPEGEATGVSFSDFLDPNDGLEILSLDTLSASSADLVSSLGGPLDNTFLANHGVIAGDSLSFSVDFGNLENQNRDNAVPETITLTYTALVRNIPNNQDAATLDNTARWNWTDGNGVDQTASDGETVTVVEPDLQVTKSVPVGLTPDAGDTFTYTLIIEHSGVSTADAFDAVLNDSIPEGLTYVGNLNSSGAPTTSLAYNPGADRIEATWESLAQGDVTTITFDVIVNDPIQAGTDLTNVAGITWTSLPDGDPGSNDANERTGDGGVNDYTDSDSLTLTVAGTIDKLDPVPSEYTIGDTVTYDIVVSLPEGNTENLVINDALPAGLQYVGHTLDITGFNGTVNNPTTNNPVGDGDDIVFTFSGTTSVIADGDVNNNSFIIRVTTLVTNLSSNQQGQSLTNEASMQYDNPAGGDPIIVEDPTDPTVTVIEPQITTDKSVVDSADAGTDASPGETLTYTVRFTNTGDSTAYEVNALDTLPSGVEFDTLLSAVDQDGVDLSGSTSMIDNLDDTVSILGDWDIAVGDWVEIEYTVTVMAAGFTAGTYTNTVDADWSSQDGIDPNERIYDDSGSSPVDGDLDDDNAVFTVITTASLGDMVFFDAGGDGGVFDAASGDVGISGINVTISADIDGDGTPEFEQTVATDADGNYLFSNLAAYDNYTVTVDYDGSDGSPFNLQNAGYSQTYDLDGIGSVHTATAISLTVGQNRDDVDFGYTGQNSVGDTIWYDADANGVLDGNEAGIGGLTVTLTGDIDGDGIAEYTATTTTNPDGFYSFDHLPAGDFEITVTPPAGSTPTYDLDGTTVSPDNSTPFSLGPDQDRDDIDFGLRGTGSIGDFVWFDADGEGDQDDGADSGVGGVTVILSGDVDGDGTPDYTTTTVTNDDGSYLFDNLLGGNYTISVDDSTLPVGMEQTYDLDGIGSAHTAAVALADGENRTDADFGYTGTTSVGDTVWFDFNDNGLQNPGEDGIGNVEVTITADIDGDGITEYTATTTTDGDGLYSFNNLPAGDYTISVVPPTGGEQTYDQDDGHGATDNQASFSMDGVNDRDDIDFGYRGTGSLGDFVWYDANFDGLQNDGPLSGLSGVTVLLAGDIDNDGSVDFTTDVTTAADGGYLFDNLLGGSYTITVDDATLPGGTANWHQTYDLDDDSGPFTTANSAVDVDLGINGADLNRSDVDFGYTGNGSIGDTVFFDTDQSGSETPGDTGITDILVTLSADVDGDGVIDFTWTDTTDANGNYLFENLPSFDNYTVTVDRSNLPAGTEQTYDLDGIATQDVVTGITLGVDEDREDVDFGYFNSGSGSIGDTVWFDADADGILDAGEQGLAGVELTLTGDITGDGIDDISFTTTTDANGNYIFDELLAGDYTVRVTDYPAGMTQTFDLDGLGTPDAASISLADGEDNNNVDFGYTGAASIGDTIYFDADGSGSETVGDAGIPGVTVTLIGDLNNDGIDDILNTTTDANGNYLFENLPDGDYVVTVDPATLPDGMNPTADPDGGDDNTSLVTLAGGVDNLDQDFGYAGTGGIGDTIWEDSNGDGTQDLGESGLSGVDVTISVDFDGDGTVDYSDTATTDANGNYSFDNLPAGEYTIAVDTSTIPSGYVLTGDPDSNPDSTSTVNLPSGGMDLDQDFGYQNLGGDTASIGDTIYYDVEGDGPGGNDIGLEGVIVTLTGDINGDGTPDVVTTTTDANGNYLFENLPNGDYTVSVDPATLPDGMVPTADPDGGDDNAAQVMLTGGVDNFDQDFGYTGSGSIGDTLFFDANNNGIQDTGEEGLFGVNVSISLDLNGDGVTDYTETVATLADGTYLFDELPAGDYAISVDPASLPGGMVQSSDPDSSLDNISMYSLAGGETNLDQDFGYTGIGSIGDSIWNDANGDGIQDPGEGGLAGVAVTITTDIDGDGSPETFTTVTDSDGNYLFENLPEGEYTITVDPATIPAGMTQSGDPDGGNDNTSSIILAAGEDNLDQDFGYNSGSGSIGDTIYFDADGDGGQNGTEPGLPGVTVTLTGDVDGDGVIDTFTTTTDDNGNYLFENLAPGDYDITVDPDTLPDGMVPTADPDGGDDNTSTVTLGVDEDNLDQDFGYQGTGTIGDTIWDDLNGDGMQDSGETGLAGVDVTISVDFDGDGTVDYTDTATTDATGSYSFENLPAGEYTIAVDTSTVPADYVLTGDPDSNPDSTSTVILPAGGTDLDQDFGYHDNGEATGSIGDTIYFDADGNGILDGSDVGLPGITVTLVGDVDGDGIADTVTTTTDSNGNYLFDNLPAGDYTITVDTASLPAGMTPTQDPDGGADNSASISLAAGEDNDIQDFGYTGTGTIGDTIYFDTDGDGIQDSGENGMPGVDVTISVDFNGDGTPDYTTTVTTDANGNYSFDNLPAGDYTVTIDPTSLPGDVSASGDPDGTPDNSTTLVLGPGEINNDQDFGYTGTGSIGDTVYFDADGNGYQSSGEPGLSGVTVTLQGDFDNDGTIESVTTTTDANGHYLFEGLTSGNYTVYVDTTTLPPGMTQTGDPDGTIDNQATVILAGGETNLDQDFGYTGPVPPRPPGSGPVPPPVEPPTGPVVPSPNPVPGQPGSGLSPSVEPMQPQGLIADAGFMYRQFHEREEFFYPFDETPWPEPILPVSPIYTGFAEPGTTLQIILYDAMGNDIGQQNVMADAAGNWLASFPATMMYDLPHHLQVEQTISSYNESSAGFFNMRTYFNPNFSSMAFSVTHLDPATIFAYLPSTIMDSMHMSNQSACTIEWDDFNGYEFLAPSTHPSRTNH